MKAKIKTGVIKKITAKVQLTREELIHIEAALDAYRVLDLKYKTEAANYLGMYEPEYNEKLVISLHENFLDLRDEVGEVGE